MSTSSLLLLLALGCGKEEPEPVGEIPEIPVPPTLEVTSPARGAFYGEGQVLLEGTATAGSAPLTSLVGDADWSVVVGDGGQFRQALSPRRGLNILGLRLEDEGLERAVDGRAFVWGPTREPGETVPDAVMMQLGPELLDDDDDDVDDIATIAELLAADPAVRDAIVGVPVETSYVVLTPTYVDYGDVTVDLVAGDEELQVDLRISDVEMDFDVEGAGGWSWISTDGTMWLDSLELDLTLGVRSGPTITVKSVQADARGYAVAVDWFPDSLEDNLAEWTQETLETSLEDQTADMIAELVGGMMDALAVEMSFGEVHPVDLAFELADAEVAPQGLRLVMDARVWSDRSPGVAGAGSVRTDGATPSWSALDGANFGVLVDDDVANQALFALWASGTLSEIELPIATMVELSGNEPEPPLGPAERLRVDFGLPPVLSPGQVEGYELQMDIGELRLAFDRTDGQVMDFSVNASAGATLFQDAESGDIGIEIDSRPANVRVEVGVLDWDRALDPGDLAALIRLLVPPLLSQAPAIMPGFPPPPIALDAFLEVEALEGVELQVQDPQFDLHETGWLQLTARLSE